MAFEQQDYDVLVIGSNLGACVAALTAADHGLRVCVFDPERNSSASPVEDYDDFCTNEEAESFEDRLLTCGHYSNHKAAVSDLVRHAQSRFRKWVEERLGASVVEQSLHYCDDGAQPLLRIIGGAGRLLKLARVAIKEHSQIEFMQGSLLELIQSQVHAVDPQLHYKKRRCGGVYAFLNDSRVIAISAKEVLLTGTGLSSLYSSAYRHGSLGGVAVALRAGLRTLQLEQMEFSALLYKRENAAYVDLPPSLLREGAFFQPIFGDETSAEAQRFLSQQEALAHYQQELLQGRKPSLALNVESVSKIEKKFPFLLGVVEATHLDRGLIPIDCCPRFHLGGIWTDLSGRTSLKGLWASGELSSRGVFGYGFNPLVELYEELFFAERVGLSLSKEVEEGRSHGVFRVRAMEDSGTSVSSEQAREAGALLQRAVDSFLGPYKDISSMRRLDTLLQELCSQFVPEEFSFDHELIDLEHRLACARAYLGASQELRRNKGLFRFSEKKQEVEDLKSRMILDSCVDELSR